MRSAHATVMKIGNENWCHFDLATYVTHEFNPVRTYVALSRRQFFHQHGSGMSHEGNCRCDLSPRHVLTTVMPADCGRHRESFDLQNERLGTIWCLYGQRSPCLFISSCVWLHIVRTEMDCNLQNVLTYLGLFTPCGA